MADDAFGGFQVDDDWKKQAQEEKRKLAEESQKAAPAPASAPASASSSPAAATTGRTRSGRGERDEPASFAGLVRSLASQALLYMGGVALSDGQGIVDLDTAKRQIDLMAVLEDKTRGNLTDEEQALLDVTLYETRMRFTGVASRYIL